jgi:hypothetical protein
MESEPKSLRKKEKALWEALIFIEGYDSCLRMLQEKN